MEIQVDPAVRTIQELARPGAAFTEKEISDALASGGWSPEHSTADPAAVPDKWLNGPQISWIIDDEESPHLILDLRITPPDPELPEYANSIENEYVAEIAEMEEVRESIFSKISAQGIRVTPLHENPEEGVDFVESSSWKAGNAFVTIGVSHEDPDLAPILLRVIVREATS